MQQDKVFFSIQQRYKDISILSEDEDEKKGWERIWNSYVTNGYMIYKDMSIKSKEESP